MTKLEQRGDLVKKIEIKYFSTDYDVRTLGMDDVGMIYDFCKKNMQYYAYCGRNISVEVIENDITIAPPGIPMKQKDYIGFFDDEVLVAIMDLIDGYPEADSVYIGFFMMNSELQGNGIGSKIVADCLEYLRNKGFNRCLLGIDKDNPQSNHFWRKNGFEIIKEVELDEGMILVAEKQL